MSTNPAPATARNANRRIQSRTLPFRIDLFPHLNIMIVATKEPRALLRSRNPENLPRLGRRRDVAAEPLGDADHALDQHGVVLRELARRDIGVVLVAHAHV